MKLVFASLFLLTPVQGRRGSSSSAPVAPLSPKSHFGGYPYYGWFLDDLADENMEAKDSMRSKNIKRVVPKKIDAKQAKQDKNECKKRGQVQSYLNDMGLE